MDDQSRSYPRFFVPFSCRAGQRIVLPAGQSAHLARVLRRSRGDLVRIFTEAGEEFVAQVTRADPKESEVEIVRMLRRARPVPTRLIVAFAPPRGERSDVVVEKATELGAHAIQPIVCERLQGFEVKAMGRRIERWRRKAVEAARQCGRTTVPQVADAVELESLFGLLPAGLRLLGDLRPELPPIWRALSELHDVPPSIAVIVGPAGGLTARELKHAEEAGCRPVSLGPNTLRVETAAIAMLAAAAFWLHANRVEAQTQ